MKDEERLMRVVVVREPGGPEKLSIYGVEKPHPGDEELLVRIRATALNRADLMQREGRYPPPEGASSVLGLEMSGTVEAKGRACPTWNIGERVFGLLSGGGYAEYCVIHRDMAVPLPASLSFEEGAAIPEVFLTAYQALHWYGEVQAGQRVLIHAGASGVGTAAIQLVRAAGATPYVTASAAKHTACMELGAEQAIDYHTEDFSERMRELTGGGGAHIIVDFVGAPYFEKNLSTLAVDGRLVMLATLGGARVDVVDLRTLFVKRASIFASTLRSRSLDYKIRLTQEFAALAVPLFEQGKLRPVIDSVYDWKDVAEAHRQMEANRNIGKIVMRITDYKT